MVIGVFALLGLFVLQKAFAPRELPGAREIYAALVIWTTMTILLDPHGVVLSRTTARRVLLWCLIFIAYLALVPLNPVVYPKYIVGDVASLLLPAFFLVCGYRYRDLFFTLPTLTRVGAVLAVAALIALAFPDETGRHQPPSLLLIAMTWTWFMLSKTRARCLLAGLAVLVLSAVAWISTVRTNAAMVLVAGALVYWLHPRLRYSVLLGIPALAVLLVARVGPIRNRVVGIVLESRFKTIASGEGDESLLGRAVEMEDVIRTIQREWPPWRYAVGYGHGSTYEPYKSYMGRNVTSEDRVHNIHIGPSMVFFRYGVFGIVLVSAMAWLTLRELLRIRSEWRLGRAEPIGIVFTTTVALYGVYFLLFNSIVDPVFSYAAAGCLCTRSPGWTRYQDQHHPAPRSLLEATAG